MRDGPKQEEDRQAAADGAHKIDAAGRGMGIVAEQDDEEPTHQNEQRSAGRVGDLQFIATGDEFSAIPETAGGFHSQYEDRAGDKAYDPARYPILADETALRIISLHVNKLDHFLSKENAGWQRTEDQSLIYFVLAGMFGFDTPGVRNILEISPLGTSFPPTGTTFVQNIPVNQKIQV